MSWSLKFDERIALANGEALRTLRYAGAALAGSAESHSDRNAALSRRGRSDVREYGATQGAELRKTKVGGLSSRCNVYAGLCRYALGWVISEMGLKRELRARTQSIPKTTQQ
jgi:hypothetical protein